MRRPPSQERRALLRQDLFLALAVAAVLVVGSDVTVKDDLWASLPDLVRGLPDPWEFVLIALGALPLTLRRVAPLSVLTVCVAASLGLQMLDRPALLPLGVLVALYTVAVMRRPLICGAAVLAYLAALTVGVATGWAPLSDDLFYTYVVALTAAVMLGYGVALGRARARLAEQRAAELAREQDIRTQAAVEQEQARIAREVHDIVAHDVSVMVAQAAAARRVFPDQPQLATQALASIEAVGRDALDGLRRLLGLLRTQRGRVERGNTAGETERSPQPGLDRLPWLLAQVRQAGLPVELIVRGRAGPLPATVELNAYRIVQEALTNSLKHAGPTSATVCLDYGEESLGIEVRDQGRTVPALAGAPDTGWRLDGHHDGDRDQPASRPATGYGRISMEQRAAMLGGDLVAEPLDGRGFRVAARLPLSGGVP